MDKSRQQDLWYGIPVLVIGILGSAIWVGARAHDVALPDEYLARTKAAIEQDNEEAVAIYLQRIRHAGWTLSNEQRFELALQLEESKNIPQAMNIYRQLAPKGHPGYPPAHRKQALNLDHLLRSSPSATVDLEEMHFHLSHADGQDSLPILTAWSHYFVAANQPELAIEKLRLAEAESSALVYSRARLHQQMGQIQAARESFEQACDVFQRRIASQPHDSQARISLADSLFELGRYERCLDVMRSFQDLGIPEVNQRHLGEVLYRWHQRLSERPQVDPLLKLDFLKASLEFHPLSHEFYERLLGYSVKNESGLPIDSERLITGITEGRLPGLSHFLISMKKYAEGDVLAADRHLEQASRLLPGMPLLLHEYVLRLTSRDEPQLGDALGIVDRLVAEYPEHVPFRLSRALVFKKLERWDAAIKDLRFALEQSQDDSTRRIIHSEMAHALEQMGHQDEANHYRKLINSEQQNAGSP